MLNKYAGKVGERDAYTKVSALGIEEQRVNVIGDFLDPPTNLGDQYRLDVQIVTWRSSDAVKVPLAALCRCAEQWCVFVVDEGRARQVRMPTGHQADDAAEVLGGLRPGHDLVMGLNRWIYRVVGYAGLMHDDYPPFRLDLGAPDPVAVRLILMQR
jgi:HlyD family secretion protein